MNTPLAEQAIPRTYWSLGLTPAQSWIAEARRSRDLLAGSRLLAWVMGRLLVHLKREGARVELPKVTEEDLESLADSFATALDNGSNGVSNHASGWVELPLTEAESLFHRLQAEWESLWSGLRAEVALDAGRSARDLWPVVDPAIDAPSCPLQLVWALRESASEPREGLGEVEAVFAAVKRSRPIPEHSGFPVRKCGQCGRREAMGGEFYLGGDEGLILAPVAEALNVARDVRRLWGETVGEEATLSMGIALFDRERPLGAAIETARRSLDRAKRMERPRKNALAVSVQTASGSEWTAVAHWDGWSRVIAAVSLIRQGTLASGWPYDVERFLRTLSKDAFESGGETRAAIREEMKRITARRCSREADRKTAWEDLQGETWWQEQPADEELATLADHLHLVAFLARESGAR